MTVQTEREALFKVLVSQEDDGAVIRRNGDFLCRLPASELAELSDVILEGLCGPAPVSSQPSAPALPAIAVMAIGEKVEALEKALRLSRAVRAEIKSPNSSVCVRMREEEAALQSNIEALRTLLPTQGDKA